MCTYITRVIFGDVQFDFHLFWGRGVDNFNIYACIFLYKYVGFFFFFFYSFFKNMLLSLIFAEDSKMTSAVKQTTSFTLHWMSLCSYSECTNTTFAIKNNVLYFYVAVFVV